MENLNFHSTTKLNSCEICSNPRTAKFNSAKMKKFRGFCVPQDFLTAKISDNKVNINFTGNLFFGFGRYCGKIFPEPAVSHSF